MQYIGFIKRFDSRRPESKDLSDMLIAQKIPESVRASIIEYLSAGYFLLGWMSFLHEEDGTPIGNNNYYTDGSYVWPLYYMYYLKKYTNLEIDEGFIEHVKSNNFIIPELSKDELANLENQYLQFR